MQESFESKSPSYKSVMLVCAFLVFLTPPITYMDIGHGLHMPSIQCLEVFYLVGQTNKSQGQCLRLIDCSDKSSDEYVLSTSSHNETRQCVPGRFSSGTLGLFGFKGQRFNFFRGGERLNW